MTIDDIYESFEFLDGWEERYGFVIDLGRALDPLDDADKTEDNKVRGCMSQVWMVGDVQEGDPIRVRFKADSDSIIVRGLIAVLMTVYGDRTPQEIIDTDIDGIFERLGFGNHISVNRRNGFFSMVERIKQIATRAAAAS